MVQVLYVPAETKAATYLEKARKNREQAAVPDEKLK